MTISSYTFSHAGVTIIVDAETADEAINAGFWPLAAITGWRPPADLGSRPWWRFWPEPYMLRLYRRAKAISDLTPLPDAASEVEPSENGHYHDSSVRLEPRAIGEAG